jgi:tetraacyldisaccharide 4'-kinase
MRILLKAYSRVSRSVCAWKAARYHSGRKSAQRASLPVIAVGNLTLGGSGKTPLVMELIDRLLGRGFHPALVTRGYRGSWEKSGGMLSDGRRVFGGWREGGDEPMMVARRYPEAGVFVGRRRLPSCLKAKDMGFDVCLLDDAFQHLEIARDLDIVIHDPRSQEPLRESETALSRADILLIPDGLDRGTIAAYRRRFPRLDVFEYVVKPRGFEPQPLPGQRILAFAGIARPERFFELLDTLGVAPVGRLAFPDHYTYPAAGRAKIAAAARRLKAKALVTTEKDAVKFGSDGLTFPGLPLHVLRIGLDLPETFYDRVVTAATRSRERNG